MICFVQIGQTGIKLMDIDESPNNKAPQQSSYWKKRVDGFSAAFKGVLTLSQGEDHAKIHLLATGLVLFAGWWFSLERWEWVGIILAMGLVWGMEALNTAIERLTDLVSPDYHPLAGKAKDLAAAAVLLTAVAAAGVGVVIFWPHVSGFFGK